MGLHLFRQRTKQLLSSEEGLLGHLRRLPQEEVVEVAAHLDALLPPVGVLIPLPGAEGVAEQLGAWRGLPVVRASGVDALRGSADAALVTTQLSDGVAELDLCLRAAHSAVRVRAVAALVERTGAGGRSRLELQGTEVLPVLEVADTPEGLLFERRDTRTHGLH